MICQVPSSAKFPPLYRFVIGRLTDQLLQFIKAVRQNNIVTDKDCTGSGAMSVSGCCPSPPPPQIVSPNSLICPDCQIIPYVRCDALGVGVYIQGPGYSRQLPGSNLDKDADKYEYLRSFLRPLCLIPVTTV
jgi:hypothetical protein